MAATRRYTRRVLSARYFIARIIDGPISLTAHETRYAFQRSAGDRFDLFARLRDEGYAGE